MLRRLTAALLLDCQVVYERLPGRRADHLMAGLLILACLVFSAVFFLSDRPSAPAASTPAKASLQAGRLYLFDKKRVSPEWYWLLSMARSSGWRGRLRSGVRTYKEQSRLYDKFLAGTGAPAFSPDGPSRHMRENMQSPWQQAVDVSRPEHLLRLARAARVPLKQPYASEPWHLEAEEDFGPPKVVVPADSTPPEATLPPPEISPSP